MFEDLAAAVDTLVVPVEGDALASVLELRDRFEARLVEAVCAFDDTTSGTAPRGVRRWRRGCGSGAV